jgi:endonuclease/exonuclease/phosphatase family metal-dependent hydrolase
LCEHWLRQEELANVQNTLGKDEYWSILKSSIAPDISFAGRPYGGVRVFCKKKTCLHYKNVECDNDRLCFVQVCNNSGVMLNVLGVYLPYWNGYKDQIDTYCETLDKMQMLIDNHCGTAPVVIVITVGDMNTMLPQAIQLHFNWYKRPPFNCYSNMLNNFLVDNDLYITNFQFEQDVNYSYHKGRHVSYIDHVLVSKYFSNHITGCKIRSEDACNVSDHFALSLSLA